MPYFKVMLHGEGINIPSEDGSDTAIGFYTTRSVPASSHEDAIEKVKGMVTNDWAEGIYALANQGLKPTLKVESVWKTTLFDHIRFRNKGYVFYPKE